MSIETNADYVESVIDQLLEGEDVERAVASVLNGEESLPESVELDLEEGDDPICLKCGNEELEFGVLETEEGEAPTIYCPECDTALVADMGESDEDDDLEEAEIDEDDPRCPSCGADQLEGQVIEDEGEEIAMLVCKSCDTGFVPVEQES